SSVSRAPTIIELVISTREKIYQEGGVNGLRTFELTDGELIPFDEYDDCDTTTQIRAHVSFRDDQSLFDMRTRIRVENGTDLTDNHSMYDFIRQFGWSIVCMEDWTQQSGLASNFDDISSTRGLSLETLSLSVSKFTTSDYERLESIIQRLPNFKQLGIRIERAAVDQSEIAHSIIERYGSLLFKLHLCRIPSMEWLVNFASLFPSRAMFPNLISFEVSFDSDRVVLGDCVRWIASMVSSPSPTDGPLSAKALSQNDVEQDTSERVRSTAPLRRMRKVVLNQMELQAEEWRTLIEAFDFTELQHLDLGCSNLSRDQLAQLVRRISGNSSSQIPLKTLNVEHTDLQKGTLSRSLGSILAEIREKMPMVKP
ncbi:hypothetical protein BGX31_009816, partial [Mortierella sp. GBA43]